MDRRHLPEGAPRRPRRSPSSSLSASTRTAGAVLGMEVGTSEAEPIWTEFLRKLTRRGLRDVKLVVSDAHEGIKAAVTKVLCATCRGAASTS